MLEKEKMLVTSIFSFSSNVFFSISDIFPFNKLFPKRQILDFSKLKEFADDNFKLDKNGRKLSKWVENTAGKGEIARSEQFLLFTQCFQKTCTADTLKPGIVWERVMPHLNCCLQML